MTSSYIHLVFYNYPGSDEWFPIAGFDKREDSIWYAEQMEEYFKETGVRYVSAARIDMNPKYPWLEEFAKKKEN